jgi:peptide subunit release factor 1 (eRF1)/transcriptional regulator with XRE-family HTH domain
MVLEMAEVKEEEKLKLKKLIRELESIKGRHTELVSVYIPAGYNLIDVINQIFQEKGTASNIKSKTTRKNVLTALEKILQHLKLFRKTPDNGLVIFCGNVSPEEGKEDIRLWSYEPPVPISQKIYWCDQTFVLEPLKDLISEKEVYGLIVLDAKEATIGLLKGKRIEKLKSLESNVPSKSVKGGMCVCPETFVQLHNGEILKIRDLKEKHNPIVSVDFCKWKVTKGFHKQIFTSSVDKVLEIKTVFPRLTIKVSPNHRFFVPTDRGIEIVCASSLKPGNYLLTVRRLNTKKKTRLPQLEIPTTCKIINNGWDVLKKRRKKLKFTQQELAKKIGIHKQTYSRFEKGKCELEKEQLDFILKMLRINQSWFYRKYVKKRFLIKLSKHTDKGFYELLGYILGDGSVEYGKITLYDQDENLLRHYECIVKRFGLSCTLNKRESKGCFELKIYSQPFIRLIERHFPGIVGVKKNIPLNIHSLPNSLLSRFIRGLFDAEGYVESSRIGIGMTNHDIICILQFLLLRFGIITSYSKEKNSNKHKLEILDLDSIKKFNNFIGFNSRQKMFKLQKILKKRKPSKKFAQVPITSKFVLGLARELGMGVRDFKTVHNFFVNGEQKTFHNFKDRILNKFLARRRELERDAKTIKELRMITRISRSKLANLVKCTYREASIEEKKMKNKELHTKMENILKQKKKEMMNKCEQIIKLLDKIYKGDVILTKIQEINQHRVKEIFYDISVPKFENFIANCIIVHNSQKRYDRIREDAINEFLTKVGEIASECFLQQELKGIIVGGPGGLKEVLVKEGYLHYQLQKKILGVKDIGSTDEYGLEELVFKSQDILKEAVISKERGLMQKFFSELKNNGNVVYGFEETKKALEAGAVDTLLISEEFNWVHVKFKCNCGFATEKDLPKYLVEKQKCPNCGQKLIEVESKEIIDEVVEKAQSFGAKVEYISTDTSEGIQFKEIGGIGAFLRYKIAQ